MGENLGAATIPTWRRERFQRRRDKCWTWRQYQGARVTQKAACFATRIQLKTIVKDSTCIQIKLNFDIECMQVLIDPFLQFLPPQYHAKLNSFGWQTGFLEQEWQVECLERSGMRHLSTRCQHPPCWCTYYADVSRSWTLFRHFSTLPVRGA